MTREEIQTELAQINGRLHGFARGGATRTKESEVELSRLNGRKAELEAAWASAPAAVALSLQERDVAVIEAELVAVRHQMEALLSRPRPMTLSGEEAEAAHVRAYAERMQELNSRLTILQAPPAPAQVAAPTMPLVTPSAFPRAVGGSGSLGRALAQTMAAETDVKALTSPEAIRDGRYAEHREQLHLQTFGRVLGDGTTEETVRNGTWAGRREGILAQIEQGNLPAGGFNVARSRAPAPRPTTTIVPHGHRQTGPMSPQLVAKLMRRGKNLGRLA